MNERMTFEKALRILPTYVSHLAKGQTELAALRNRVSGEIKRLYMELLEEIDTMHSKSFSTAATKEINRKIEQLERFLETTT